MAMVMERTKPARVGKAAWAGRWRGAAVVVCVLVQMALVSSHLWHHHDHDEHAGGGGDDQTCAVCAAAVTERGDGLAAPSMEIGPARWTGEVEAWASEEPGRGVERVMMARGPPRFGAGGCRDASRL